MKFMRRMLWIFFIFQALAGAGAGAVRAGGAERSPLAGFWVTPDGDWVIEITSCAGGFCGQLVGLSQSHRPGIMTTDSHNPDPARRGTPLCGLILMGNFKPVKSEAGSWDGGWAYDPQNGKTYSGTLRLSGPDLLALRGYVFIPLFGHTEIFTRETGPINRCAATASL
jgi:uncharacterized protein (DUF2147 family)